MNYTITKNIEKTVKEIEAFVESESREGAFYKVSYSIEDGWNCTCPDNRHRGNPCKHIVAIRGEFE